MLPHGIERHASFDRPCVRGFRQHELPVLEIVQVQRDVPITEASRQPVDDLAAEPREIEFLEIRYPVREGPSLRDHRHPRPGLYVGPEDVEYHGCARFVHVQPGGQAVRYHALL